MDYPAGALNHSLKLEKLAEKYESEELERFNELKEQIANNTTRWVGHSGYNYTAIDDVVEELSTKRLEQDYFNVFKQAVNDNVSNDEIGKLFRECLKSAMINLAKSD